MLVPNEKLTALAVSWCLESRSNSSLAVIATGYCPVLAFVVAETGVEENIFDRQWLHLTAPLYTTNCSQLYSSVSEIFHIVKYLTPSARKNSRLPLPGGEGDSPRTASAKCAA